MSDCIIQLALICLFDPANVSLTGEALWKVDGDYDFYYAGEVYDGWHGSLKLAVDVPVTPTFTMHYGFEHRSYLSAGDRGYETANVGFTWRPWARQ